eukprot:TRINITY_DN193_c0_g1_i1.p1 TRINITY_DN193_c0_g1~~TRINITY_DN193_c0_g1_i1.p1  ORF type:complete len:206 (+),score=46.90 TRINITY_DN193_c0_g1_i1:162-779(+)
MIINILNILAGIVDSHFLILLGEFKRVYFPTMGAEVHTMEWYTSAGTVELLVWDTAGQEKFSQLKDGYYIGADAVIIMFDVTSRMTYKNVATWYRDIERVCGSIPAVLVGNKVDIRDRKVKPRQIVFHRRKNIQYYDISVKSNYNYVKPFLYLLRRLSGDRNLTLVEQPDLKPKEIEMTPQQIEELKMMAAETSSYTIPDMDENF